MATKYKNETSFEFDASLMQWTTIPNHILNNPNVSYKALGIYVQILQYQNSQTHKVYQKTLSEYRTEKKGAVKSGLDELIQEGYLQKIQLRDEKGRMSGVKYRVFAEPVFVEEKASNPVVEPLSTETQKSAFGSSDIGSLAPKKENNIKNKINLLNKEKETTPNVVDVASESLEFFIQNIKMNQASPYEIKIINSLIALSSESLVVFAMETAIENNKPNLKYVKALIEDWSCKGLVTRDDVELMFAKWSAKNQQAKANREKKVNRASQNITQGKSSNEGEINPMSFNNFEPRPHDYDKLENELLGWNGNSEEDANVDVASMLNQLRNSDKF